MEILISGASTGLGRACSVHMARLGHSVWAGVRSQKSFDDILRLNIKGLRPVILDVTDSASIQQCISTIIKNAGTLDALVNNAGIAVAGPFEAISMEDWRRQFETNVFGLIALTQACLPQLRENKGRVVNISSISGRIAIPFFGPYSASKWAVEALSDALRREMVAFGVHVSVVEPGAILTPIWEKARKEGMDQPESYSPAIQELYGKAIKKLAQRVEQTTKAASPISVVTQAVEHALTARHPKTRYPVGKGIKTSAVLSRIVPDRWLDKLIR